MMLKAHGDTMLATPDLYDLHGLICDEAWLAAGGELPTISCHHHRHSSLADDWDISYLKRVHFEEARR